MEQTAVLAAEGDMMPDALQPPLTEPEIVPCLFVTGLAIEIADSVVRLVGWVTLPSLGGETEERRIVMRVAMSNTQARNFQSILRKGLSAGKH